jgi:hypothetical protein
MVNVPQSDEFLFILPGSVWLVWSEKSPGSVSVEISVGMMGEQT